VEGVVSRDFWRGKRVLVTGHTGFKGGWLALWLQSMGAKVTGFALAPETDPSFHDALNLSALIDSRIGDIRNLDALADVFVASQPEIVIHMAAQALVLRSYDDPLGTYGTNVMGTAHVLECVRRSKSVRAVVIVTTDKCYADQAWVWGYRETDQLGGKDPYSSSKACTELLTQSFRSAFFSDLDKPLIASARAGNVIGGGDWSDNRIVPDLVRAANKGESIILRHPGAVRPWQFVLDPLSGYLLIAERLHGGDRDAAEAWNFGPDTATLHTVGDVVTAFESLWQGAAAPPVAANSSRAETFVLRLDSTKARLRLAWRPRLDFEQAMAWTVDWYRTYSADRGAIKALSLRQIEAYLVPAEAEVEGA
jgi:CDP-glucose 4,6-dehydratase